MGNGRQHLDIPLAPGETLTFGVISDTHVPDRQLRISPKIKEIFREARVSLILHAGDVATPAVLKELGEISPVTAVRGNRDWVFGRALPMEVEIRAGDVVVGMTHGHGGLLPYFIDKFNFLSQGYHAERYQRFARRVFPDARVIIYGHTHYPDNTWKDGVLYFNPGAAGMPAHGVLGPSVGLLTVGPGARVDARIVPLEE